jgi:3-methyladenine DNA glycosylase/8-oxoguanine DNA glycosylase
VEAEPPYNALEASRALAAADARLADVIAAIGPPALEVRPVETFPALVRAVVYQQITGKAAATIWGRLLDAFSTDDGGADGDLRQPDPAAVAAAPEGALRACGLSRAKAASARDLAARWLDGRLPPRADLLGKPDDEVVRTLTAARGVGPWTAQMLLLFTLGRPDVWPATDLGVQEGYRIVAGLGERPSPRALAEAGERYRPWRSVAAWYLWRAVDARRAGRL